MDSKNRNFYEPAMSTSEHCYNIHVGVLPLVTGLEIMDVWLTKGNPTESAWNDAQSFPIHPPPPEPLYLRLLFHHTQHWNSYTDTNINVATSTLEAIQLCFSNLEDQYRALGCIIAAKSGLTERELEDILQCLLTILCLSVFGSVRPRSVAIACLALEEY